jgi:hypothetical protein
MLLWRPVARIVADLAGPGGGSMAQQLDTTTAVELISDLDRHFARQRRYLMPPYFPTGMKGWSEHKQTLNCDEFQKIADEMRLYLGLTEAVRVRLLTRMFDHENAGTGLGGMQWSENLWDGEIVLACRPHLQTVHLAAALAHEMTHAFLGHHGFRGANEERNELLTEAGAVYLGMGLLLSDGYASISWQERSPPPMPGFGQETITHTESIGYVDVDSISILMDLSSRCSGCHYSDVSSTISTPGDNTVDGDAANVTDTRKVATRRRALPLFRHLAEQRRRGRSEETAHVLQKIEEMERLYDKLEARFTSQSFLRRASTLVGPEWSEVGKTYALFASGRLSLDVNGLKARMSCLKDASRWDAQEAREIVAEVTRNTQSFRTVLELLDKLDQKGP